MSEPNGSDGSPDLRREWSNPSSRIRKLTLFERCQVFGRGLWGFLQARPMEPHRVKHSVRMFIPKVSDEFIWVDRLNVELAKD